MFSRLALETPGPYMWGLFSGWVTNMARGQRIRTYKVTAVDRRGRVTPIDATSLVIEISPGVEIELQLSTHFKDELVLNTPSLATMASSPGTVGEFGITFGGANFVHLSVTKPGGSQRRKRG